MLALGLMSGTSCDGVSAALVQFHGRSLRVLAESTRPYPARFARTLQRAHALTALGLSALNMELGERFGRAALALLSAARVSRRRVAVIGSHGHTVYHGPRDRTPSTLQLGEPAVIAERTGLPVVADFRMRDMAAGGEGAPLISAFDEAFFGNGPVRALQNIGGIANVTVVGRGLRPLAFLGREVFATPSWLLDQDLLRRIEHGGSIERVRQAQTARLNKLLEPGRMQRLIEQEAFDPRGTYRLTELFDDVRQAIWGDVARGATVDVYRRNLQRAHVERLEYLLTQEPAATTTQVAGLARNPVDVSQSDIRALARAQLGELETLAQRGAAVTADRVMRAHLNDVMAKIGALLRPR